MKPAVGFVLPAFNAARFIGEAIRSLQSQDYSNLQRIIVVNDGSQDDTSEVAERVGDGDPRVEVHTIANCGPGSARNIGAGFLGESVDYLGFLDADDVLEPGAITHLVSAIGPTYVGTHGLGRFIDEFSDPIPEEGMLILHKKGLFLSHPTDLAKSLRNRQIITATGITTIEPGTPTGLATLCLGNCILSGSFLIKSDVFRQCGGYPEGRLVEDWEMYVRACAHGSFAFLDRTTMCYRLHGPGLMSSSTFARDGAAFRLDLRALLSDDLRSLYDKFVLKEMVRPLIRMALGSLKRGRVSDFRFYSGIARRAWLVSR